MAHDANLRNSQVEKEAREKDSELARGAKLLASCCTILTKVGRFDITKWLDPSLWNGKDLDAIVKVMGLMVERLAGAGAPVVAD
jgi:hypothetical protein